MAVEVVGTEEFEEWYLALDKASTKAVARYVELLQEHGVTLSSPHSSKIKGAGINLRELRVTAAAHVYRVFYTFDPKRQAVVLLGGDKKGDDRFYERMVPKAEEAYEKYLSEA